MKLFGERISIGDVHGRSSLAYDILRMPMSGQIRCGWREGQHQHADL